MNQFCDVFNHTLLNKPKKEKQKLTEVFTERIVKVTSKYFIKKEHTILK